MDRNYIKIGFHISQTALAVYLSFLAFEAWNNAPVVTSGVQLLIETSCIFLNIFCYLQCPMIASKM